MSQNLWVLIGKGIAKKIHCCFAVFILLAFVGAAHAAGYTCPSSKKYTSCNSGYYMNGTGAGNSCTSCTTVSATDLSQSCTRSPTSTELSNAHASAGTVTNGTKKCTGKHTGGAGGTNGASSCSGCSSWGSCSGGTLTITTCSAGYYKSGNSCVACGGNNYYCPGDNSRKTVSSGYYSTGGTSSTTRTGQAACGGNQYYCSGGVRNNVSSGHYSTGGTSTTRTGQAACGGNQYYCSGGVRNNVSSGHYSTGGTSTTRTGQSQCGGNQYYCSGGVRNSVSSGYYSTGGTSTTRTGQSQCTGATYCSGGVQNSCPSGYDDNLNAGKTQDTQCQISVAGGRYIGTRNSSTVSLCNKGYYRESHTVSYGNTSSCRACSGRTRYTSTTGAASCSTVSAGYYTTGCNTSGNACTGQSRCTGATYCSGGVQNSCPVTAIDQTGYPWHYSADPGSTAVNDCYVYGNATEFSDYCAAGQWRLYYDSSEGDYETFIESSTVTAKPGAYVDDSFHVAPTCTQCNGAKYSEGGDVHSCLTCPTIYTDDTTAGKSAARQCKVVTDPGYYIAANNDDKQTQCTTQHYCPSATISYGSHNAPTACPDPETHSVTAAELPDKFYDATILYTSVQAWFTGGVPWTKETDCRAQYSMDNSRGHLITDNVVYNASTKKYDDFQRNAYYPSVNPGYYLKDKISEEQCDIDTNTMLYADAQPCPAGSYCPGLTSMPSCASGTYNDTLGINACPANYGTSPAQSTANTQCYLTTTAGKWVATKNAAQTSCTAGGFCVGGVKVNYGSTGGRTPAAAGYYVSTTGATTQTACAAGTYTSTTGQTKCTDAVAGTYTTGCKITSNNTACTGTAVCATNTYSDARASVCIACNTADKYNNRGTLASDHAGIASCKVYCSGGEYVPSAGDGCVDVGVGYWGAGGTVSQTATLARNACDTGLTTIGSGAGADEAGDCGRVLNVGDEKIYLRSTKKTTPSLNISINGDVFYGNMSTADGGSSLRINSGGTVYSVYDDANPPSSHTGGVH